MDTLNLQVGKYIQQYKLIKFIGKGSSAVVWEVQDSKMRKYALKLYSPSAQLSSISKSSFIEEFNFAKGIDSKNVVKYHHLGIHAGRPFFIMDLCFASFRHYLEQASAQQFSAIKESNYVDLLYQLCSGIDALNKNGIIHNDIKPDNILLSEERGKTVFKLTDFGVSSSFKKNLERETIIKSTPHKGFTPYYSAPECSKGISRANSDIYSIGVILTELMTGKAPRNEADAKELLTQKTGQVSNKLISIIYLCLRHNSSERPNLQQILKWCRGFIDTGYWSSDVPVVLSKVQNQRLIKKDQAQPFGTSENALKIIDRINHSKKSKKSISVSRFISALKPKMDFSFIKGKLNADIIRKIKWPLAGIFGFVLFLNISIALLLNFSHSSALLDIAKYSSFLLLPSLSKKVLDRSNNAGVLKIRKGQNEKWGATNSIGELIIPYKYDKIEKFEFKNKSTRYSILRINGKCGFVCQDGRVTKSLYDICSMVDEKTGLYEVKNKYGKIEKRPILLDRYFDN